jgi:MFS family permease
MRKIIKKQVFDWRTIAALNIVSTLAQVGQFGIAYVVLPVWMADHAFGAGQIGLFAASLWLGQLPGLGFAPRLSNWMGARQVIVLGLVCTGLAMLCFAATPWPFFLAGGLLAGFGLGLRWIGLEPWLYRIAPAHARGRLVGFHETLIALAPIIAPLTAGYVGMQGRTVFGIGALFAVAGMLPLAWTRKPPRDIAVDSGISLLTTLRVSLGQRIFRQGVLIAVLGGMLEAAVSGLFAVYTQHRGIGALQTADLLAVFGVGGLLLQYPVGWLVDHLSLRTAAVACAAGTALVAVVLAMPLEYPQLLVAVFLLGGLITAFLTLALIASTLTGGNMSGNVSLISMFYTLSAVAGPLIAGALVVAVNGNALMAFAAVVAAMMALAMASTSRDSQP